MNTKPGRVIAIDVGNGYGKAAILLDEKSDPIYLLPPDMPVGMRTLAYVSPEGDISVNSPPDRRPNRAVNNVKMQLGRDIRLKEGELSYTVHADAVFSELARELIRLANTVLAERGEPPVYDVVLTYPADFAGSSAVKTMQKCVESISVEGSPIKVVGMISEPAAAAVDALYFSRELTASVGDGEHNLLVCDVGYGTLDVALVTSTHERERPYTLISQQSDPDIGGRAFDEKIYCELLRKRLGISDAPITSMEHEMLRGYAQDMKHELSGAAPDGSAFRRYMSESIGYCDASLSRPRFEELIAPDLNNIFALVYEHMENAKALGLQIHGITLTGGSCRIPAIKAFLEEKLAGSGIPVNLHRASHAVVFGAARYATGIRTHHPESGADTPAPKPAQNTVLRRHTEYAYGIYIGGDVCVFLPSGMELPAVSAEPVALSCESREMDVRICRSLERNRTGDRIPRGEYRELERFKFAVAPGEECVFSLTMDENRLFTVVCTHEDGRREEQESFVKRG